MFDFNLKKNVFLGVDIGTDSIKMVEIKVSDGKPILSNYAWMKLGDAVLGKSENKADYSQVILPQCIKRIIKKAKFSARNTYAALPAFGGLITLIDFPEMAEADMEQAIKFEAHKYIPTSLDEVVISWEVVERKENPEKSPEEKMLDKNIDGENAVKVLLVAASRKKVLRYEGIVREAGLKLKSIDIETFSIARSLIGNDPGSFIIVDIGSSVCNIILVEKGVIRINRNIDAGGFEMTRTIAKSMGIDFERAEALKVSGKDFFASDSAISFFTLELITGEVERIIRAYSKNGSKDKIDKIILSGGTAKMVGIVDYFFKKLGISSVVGSPFARVGYDVRLKPFISAIQNDFAVSVGLALKGVDEYLKNNVKEK